jgi:hypothetical protein
MAQGDSHTEYIIHVVCEDYENTYYGYTEFSTALHDAENWYGKDGRWEVIAVTKTVIASNMEALCH